MRLAMYSPPGDLTRGSQDFCFPSVMLDLRHVLVWLVPVRVFARCGVSCGRGSDICRATFRTFPFPAHQEAAPMANITSFADKDTIARQTARMLLEVEAVRFSAEKPFIFTSGWASPVYTDCRRLISFPRVRQTLVDFGITTLYRDVGYEQFDAVAGGETAGIPFAAWVSDRMMLPMQYVRKKPKGFGRNAQIEGDLSPGQRILLVEDLTSDGRSKVNFVNALRTAGAECSHCFVFFYYGIFPEAKDVLKNAGLDLHYLATWWDVLAEVKATNRFDTKTIEQIEAFLHDPHGWSAAHGGAAAVSE